MLERFVAGVVGAPFGVKGHVKVRVHSGETSHLENLDKAVLRLGSVERSYAVESTAGAPSSFVMKFAGVDSPEAAKLLQGAELLVDRAHAAPLEDGEYYIEDLRGLSVVLGSARGERIGELESILEGGGGQLAELRLSGGAQRLVPFRNEFFGDIDLEGRTIVLREEWILE